MTTTAQNRPPKPPPRKSIPGWVGSINPTLPSNELIAPNRPSNACIPIAPTNGGRIRGTRTSAVIAALPGNSYLAAITPIGSVTIRHSSVVITAMPRALRSPVRYSGSRSTPTPSPTKYFTVNPPVTSSTKPPCTVKQIGQIRNAARIASSRPNSP